MPTYFQDRMLFVFVLNKKAMPVVEELKEFSSVADDPSGATGCTTHGINPKTCVILLYNLIL